MHKLLPEQVTQQQQNYFSHLGTHAHKCSLTPPPSHQPISYR